MKFSIKGDSETLNLGNLSNFDSVPQTITENVEGTRISIEEVGSADEMD